MSRELAGVLRRWNVNICRMQETKLKGEKTRGIGEYKIIYIGKTSTRNDVGVILDDVMKGKVIEVIKKYNRIIVVKAGNIRE